MALSIPIGNEKLHIELTVTEAMALSSGVTFWKKPELATRARIKIKHELDAWLIPQSEKLHYEAIEV